MRSGRVVALATVALVVGCASGGPVRPETGPAAGPVTVEVSAEPSPGATIVLDLSAADDRAVGSACATIDRWDSGGWRSTWWWERRSSSAQAIARGDEVSCPAIGVPLPTRMTLQLPDDLDAGTWRVAYAAGDDLGAYIFEVA